MFLFYVLVVISLLMGVSTVVQSSSLKKTVSENVYRVEGIYGNTNQFINTISEGMDSRKRGLEKMSGDLNNIRSSLSAFESRYINNNNRGIHISKKRIAAGS